MNNKEFEEKVKQKYSNATVHSDGQENIVAVIIEEGSLKILGCQLCFNKDDVRVENEEVIIQNTKAIPLTALSEDDSFNPLLPNLFLCPICSRIIVHPEIANLPLIGRTWEETAY